jgi:acid phosphatase (class A)
MTRKSLTAGLLLLSAGAFAQTHSEIPVAAETSAKTPAAHAYYYIDSSPLHLDRIIPPPPSQSSAATTAELTELHSIEAARTPEQLRQAEADDQEEDIFIFKTVLGPRFTADALPLTAALSAHVRKDESAVGGPLKTIYRRPRPYQLDSTLHPVCPLNAEPTSYPSGHSLSGYLLAFTLVQLVPEKRQQILDRADQFVHNRLICGVRYASDTQAGRIVAYAIFGSLVASPKFQQDLAAASEETRRKLGLPLALSRP